MGAVLKPDSAIPRLSIGLERGKKVQSRRNRLSIRRDNGYLASTVPNLDSEAIHVPLRLKQRVVVVLAFDNDRWSLNVAGFIDPINSVSNHPRAVATQKRKLGHEGIEVPPH
jgi:hypothetical protein